MNLKKIIFKNFKFYRKEHFLVLIGVIVSTAVLAAALMIGDSVKYSLQDIVNKRLGNTYQIIQAQGRFFPVELSEKLNSEYNLNTAPVLILKGTAGVDNSEKQLTDVQIIGINESFNTVNNSKFELNNNEVIINKKISEELNLTKGSNILVKIEKASFVNLNAPFVPDEDNFISIRLKIKDIKDENHLGNFNLKTDQITPYNIFISSNQLSKLFFSSEYANHIIISDQNYSKDSIEKLIQNIWELIDINLIFRDIEIKNKIELLSDRIFIEQTVSDLLDKSIHNPKPVFTYLINFIRSGNKETPYSFVTGIDNERIYKLKDNEIIINQWLANDLDVKVKDTLNLEYFIVGNLRTLVETKESFIIKAIVPIEGFAADSLLMPGFEGLQNVDHCSDWDAGIPMDYSKIRDKDEKYWDEYRGTPKAFISYEKAKNIWFNTQGNLTALRFNNIVNKDSIADYILNNLKPSEIGLQVYDIKEESQWSASNAVDFAQLFLGLSFFLILAAFILTGLLFGILLNNRKKEQGIYLSLGIAVKKIKKIFLFEGLIIAVTGSLIGVFSGILLNKAVLLFLNSIWYDIVRTSSINLYIKPLTLILAFLINVVIAGFVIWFTLRKRMKQSINELNKQIITDISLTRKTGKYTRILLLSGIMIFMGLLIWSFITGIYNSSNLFFLNGFVLLAVLLAGTSLYLRKRTNSKIININTTKLAIRNLSFSRKKNLSVIGILAIGIFIVISTGMNRVDFHRNAKDVKSGSGAYDFFIETNLPVNADLNTEEGLEKVGLEKFNDSVNFVQFSAIDGDDASCLNLNRIIRPRIIGFNPSQFSKRAAFSFVKQIEETNKAWNLLNKQLTDNCIPAIADQTVIKWGLGKAVGDSISYLNERGDTIHLVLVGGLANSVFQGNLIISKENFQKHYPGIAGSKIILAETIGDKEYFKDQLYKTFRNNGIKIENTADRLEMFNSITNTYLDIFLALGGIALILGTFGIAIVLLRSISEQESIIAAMQAIGIKKKQISTVIRKEYIFVLLLGVFIGTITAFSATLPSIISNKSDLPFLLLSIIIGIFLINGLIWINISIKRSISGDFIRKLRNE